MHDKQPIIHPIDSVQKSQLRLYRLAMMLSRTDGIHFSSLSVYPPVLRIISYVGGDPVEGVASLDDVTSQEN